MCVCRGHLKGGKPAVFRWSGEGWFRRTGQALNSLAVYALKGMPRWKDTGRGAILTSVNQRLPYIL